MTSKNFGGKTKENVLKRKHLLILYESNINIPVGDYVLSKIVHINSNISVTDEVSSTSSQIAVVQEVLLSEVSKLNDQVMNTKQGD